jgi:protein-S-isoprenylcysteine O-methyltransferase Ste14
MGGFGAFAYGTKFVNTFDWLGGYNLLLALICALLAAAFITPSVITFAKEKTTVNPYTPKRSSTLVTTGVYRLSRNPMYLAMALALLAWCVYLDNLLNLGAVVGFVVYMNELQIEFEEKILLQVFGEQYEEYCSQVRRWI